jgi:hypothetical protein
VSGFVGMPAIPGIPVADAHGVERLLANQEAQTGRIGLGIKIAGKYDESSALCHQSLNMAGGKNRLHFSLIFVIQLPIREVVDQQHGAKRLRRLNLYHEGCAGEVCHARCDMEIKFANLAERTATRDRDADPIRRAFSRMQDVVCRANKIEDLIIVVSTDSLLQGDQIRGELANAIDKYLPPSSPISALLN